MNSPRPREDQLSVAVSTNAGAVWIQIRGELDPDTHDELQTVLKGCRLRYRRRRTPAARSAHLLRFGGARILLMFEREARLKGHNTTINGADRLVRKILTLLAGPDQPTFA